MTELNQDLLFEILRRIQTDISSLKEGVRDLRHDFNGLRNHMHVMQGDINHLHSVNTQILDRLERIESRLELRELAEAQARFEPHP
jgi:DNA anti-recombination protein RmuC